MQSLSPVQEFVTLSCYCAASGVVHDVCVCVCIVSVVWLSVPCIPCCAVCRAALCTCVSVCAGVYAFGGVLCVLCCVRVCAYSCVHLLFISSNSGISFTFALWPSSLANARQCLPASPPPPGRMPVVTAQRPQTPSSLLQSLSIVDVCYAPVLSRFGAQLPTFRAFSLRANPKFPNLRRWYEAMEALPAYQRVNSDDGTHNLVINRLFKVLGHVLGAAVLSGWGVSC